ncbi:PadR family transcriptional regulator [Solicola gregarius]|uniref:PadR family transcriptional regulator n=1 Tax=Solicola gregarius TaxID=2908642 RepID=A0AA46YP24_9ACTN|nr:PadR family transcriptional regulator [Solicola gregarius]UYM07213.1 PadR family transcriptional regulator [Solicola gregarius]
MALDHAILVSLAERSASGYDLARRFDKSIGFFWKATHQQIYKVLARMEAAGWLEATAVEEPGRPAKKVYALTADGRGELTRWTAEPTPTESVRSDFAVKVRGMQFGDRGAVIADIARQRDRHIDRLAYYEADCTKHFPEPERLTDGELPAYLVLRGGIRTEQTYIEWCDEMLDALGAPKPRSKR